MIIIQNNDHNHNNDDNDNNNDANRGPIKNPYDPPLRQATSPILSY